MKLVVNWVSLCIVLAAFAASCADPPEYSNTPEILFDNIIFRDVVDPALPDSLIITVKFKDGDGDLGLDPQETGPPYHDQVFYQITPGGLIPVWKLANDGTYITYKTKRAMGVNDTLPDFVHPYNCVNWEIKTVNSKVDTFYFQLNPNHYNIFVDFFYFDNSIQDYKEFNWQTELHYPGCGQTYDGRFPILSKDLGQATPLDGSIRYAMQSTGFLVLFSTKTLKLKVTIQDRALHKSNTIETIPPFTLQQITKKG
jgi:hypothetical protein